MERTSHRASVSGDNGQRVYLVLMRDDQADAPIRRYRWHEEATDADTEVSAPTIKQAITNARAVWGAPIWDLHLHHTV